MRFALLLALPLIASASACGGASSSPPPAMPARVAHQAPEAVPPAPAEASHADAAAPADQSAEPAIQPAGDAPGLATPVTGAAGKPGASGPPVGLDDRDVYGGLLGNEVGEYAPPSLSVELSVGSIKGGLNKADAESVMKLAQESFQACASQGSIGFGTTLRVTFRIGAKGKTTRIKAKGADKRLNDCIVKVVRRLQFQESKKASTVIADVALSTEGEGGWGYGVAGVGPGGGGTGWGTIGTGKYGTIGHGSGSGTGYGTGGLRGTAAKPPQVRIGNATAIGDLDKNIIRRYIRRKLPRVRHCYEKQLLIEPKLKGTVITKFRILPDGKVGPVSATGLKPVVASCVAAVLQGIQFPKPKGGGVVNVTYPFSFVPAK